MSEQLDPFGDFVENYLNQKMEEQEMEIEDGNGYCYDGANRKDGQKHQPISQSLLWTRQGTV
jgi:hypothetical protein